MNLVDSCGWLEYFAEGPNAGFFAPAIEDVDNLVVASISVCEVFKRVMEQRDENAALLAAASMRQGTAADLDFSIAVFAAKIGRELDLPLADSVILATARNHNALVWTQDAHFRNIAGVRYIQARKSK